MTHTYDLILRWGVGDTTRGRVRDENGVEYEGAVRNNPEFRALPPEEQINALVNAAVRGLEPLNHAAPPPHHGPALTLTAMEGGDEPVEEAPPEKPKKGKGRGKA